jgi:hypothetical protein
LTTTIRRRTARGPLAFAVVLILPLAACGASEPKAYGPTTAGPTKTSRPSTSPPDDLPTPVATRTHVIGAALCNLFTTAEITDRLGLEVSKGTAVKSGPYSVCTWKTTTAVNKRVPGGGGIVTITRADGKYYPDLEKKIRAVAKAKHGHRHLAGIGDTAFALGALVSGVPIWNAATLQGNLMTAVEVSGAKSKSSVRTVTDFLVEVVARG